MMSGPDPAADVRAEFERLIAGLPADADLVAAVHARARRIRRRRGVLGGVVGVLGVAAALAVGTTLFPGTGPTARTDDPVASAPAGSAPAEPSFAPTLRGDEFSATTVDPGFWVVYDGPSGLPTTAFTPAAVAVRDGYLALSVTRPAAGGPAAAGGIGAMAGPSRYGRWEIRWRVAAGSDPGAVGELTLNPEDGGPTAFTVTLRQAENQLVTSGPGPVRQRSVPLDRPGDFHIVAVEWRPGGIRTLLDGHVVLDQPDVRPAGRLWPAVQTLGLGSGCAGCAPTVFEVDYMRFQAYAG